MEKRRAPDALKIANEKVVIYEILFECGACGIAMLANIKGGISSIVLTQARTILGKIQVLSGK